jgi:hypothetical protein
MQENVSYEVRKKRSRKLHAIVHRLLNLKKLKQNKIAPDAVLKKRAQKLARTLLRKKVAGLQGSNYSQIPTSQRIAIDKLLDKLPKSRIGALAKRLLPVVRKAEQARVKGVRSKRQQVTESFKHHIRRKQSARLRRKERERGGYDAPQRPNPKGLQRSSGMKIRDATLQRKFPGLNLRNADPYTKAAVRAMLSKGDKKRAAKAKKHVSTRSRRAEAERLTRPSSTRKYDYGSMHLTNSWELNMIADIILEGEFTAGQEKKFQQLFIRGLVEKNKVEQYKRIFRNLPESIKYQRFQNDIASILDKLIDMINEDDVIYRRIRLNLLKNKG